MKLRTVLISVVVSAALIGGAGYGAYYAAQSRKSPVEVVPVSNVSMGYYGMNEQETIYGSVTSQVAQTVQLNDEYVVDKIYVKAGDKVREGTPLFSYDMTLQELELEMQQLELQTNELTMTRLEKELAKLKETPASASLERDWLTLTASAEGATEEPLIESEEPVIEEPEEEDGQEKSGAKTEPKDPDASQEKVNEIAIDSVEEIGKGEADAMASGLSPVEDSVLSFENLVLELQTTFLACGDQLKAIDVGEAIEKAVSYYRKNLAEEKITEEEQEDGSVKEIRKYVLKDSVKEALSEEEIEDLREQSKTLNKYQMEYVEMLIDEAGELEMSELEEAVEKIEEAYEQLATKQQDKVENLDKLEELKALAAETENQPSGGADFSEGDGTQSVEDESQPGENGTQTVEDGSQESQPAGDGTQESQPTGDGTQESQPAGDETQESQPAGDGTQESQSAGDETQESQPAGDETQESQPAGDETQESQPTGNETQGESQPSEGNDGQDTQNTESSENQETDGSGATENQDVRRNTVTFDVSEGAVVTVADTDATNSYAMAEDGKIVFRIELADGYELTDVLVDGTIPARKNEETEDPDDYVIEGIQTNDTVVFVRTRATQDASASEEGAAGTYTVTINPWNRTETYEAGKLVPLQADMSDVTLLFTGWSVVPASGDAAQSVELNSEDVEKGYASFTMPEFDVVATARYQNAPDVIDSYVSTFLSNAEKLLAENAEQTYTGMDKDFVAELEGAIVFYQQWLSDATPLVQDEAERRGPEMEMYQLLDNVNSYLIEQGREMQITQLTDSYKELCILYVKTLFEKLDPSALDKELLEKAIDAYEQLGENWKTELEERWKNEQAALADQAGQPWNTDEQGNWVAPEGYAGIWDTLAAYRIIQMFQEYQNLPLETAEADRYDMAMEIWKNYMELTDVQKALVSSDPFFVDMLRQYGLWEDPQTEPMIEGEPQTEFPDYYGDDYDGFDDYMGDEPMYTAEELAEMIRDKEQEIKSCALDIRQSELDLKQKQRIVDGKIVKSTMDGTVVSIGGSDGESDEDYFVKVANEAGLYAKGVMNELSLEKISVGDTISGMLQNGVGFTAVIKEISEYPDAGGAYMSYGQENTNASYYPFYALIENTEDIEEGDAEIYLSATAPGQDNGIYLENFFIRSEPDGRTYVYKEGEKGNLTKQYVTTGKNMYGYAMEIVEGLTLEDHIAFPYGKDVVEGAKTKEVDRLQDAYM